MGPMKLLTLRCDGPNRKAPCEKRVDGPDKRNDVPHESDNNRTCINIACGMRNCGKCRLVVDHNSYLEPQYGNETPGTQPSGVTRRGMKNEVVDLGSRNMLTNTKCLHIYRILR